MNERKMSIFLLYMIILFYNIIKEFSEKIYTYIIIDMIIIILQS